MVDVETQGIVHIYTGDGKGKTTAALGLALRGSGYGMKTAMIQFIKGDWHYGELDAAKLTDFLEIHPMGKGFVGILGDDKPRKEHEAAAEKALEFAYEKMKSEEFHNIILDEVHNAIALGLIDKQKLIDFINEKPKSVNLILTGRDAHPDIIHKADLVSNMTLVKHYYDKGRDAIKGIEF